MSVLMITVSATTGGICLSKLITHKHLLKKQDRYILLFAGIIGIIPFIYFVLYPRTYTVLYEKIDRPLIILANSDDKSIVMEDEEILNVQHICEKEYCLYNDYILKKRIYTPIFDTPTLSQCIDEIRKNTGEVNRKIHGPNLEKLIK